MYLSLSQTLYNCLFTGRNEVVEKVMFLLVSVILSTGGVSSRENPPWAGRPPPTGRSPLPGRENPPGQGEPPWQGGHPGRETPQQGDPPSKENPAGQRDPPQQGDPHGRKTPPPAYGQ